MIVAGVDPTLDPAAWRAWRRGGLGASDAAGIVGLSPWSSPWSIWADKVGLTPDRQASEEMEAGQWLERAVRPWYTERTGDAVHGAQTALVHEHHDWARCTVDGLIGTDAVLEIKTERYGADWTTIPAHHAAQGQWQLAVTGRDRVAFAVLHGRRLRTYDLDRDDADIAFLLDAGAAFWHDHVQTQQPPPVDGSDATLDALAAVFGDVSPGEARELDDHADVVAAWNRARAAKRTAEIDVATAQAEIEARLGNCEIGTIDGRPVVTWRTQTRTTVCKACGHEETSEPFRVLRARKGKL